MASEHRRQVLFATVVVALTCSAPATGHAALGAYLSWSASDPHVSDLAGPPPTANLYVWFTDLPDPLYNGADVELVWDPPGDQVWCMAQVGTFIKTSSGSDCTYLNRGTAIPVTLYDEAGHYEVSWGNAVSTPLCTSGIAFFATFEFDGCPQGLVSGCIAFGPATAPYLCITSSPACHTPVYPDVVGPPATVNGGGGHAFCATPVAPTRWGGVKALYAR